MRDEPVTRRTAEDETVKRVDYDRIAPTYDQRFAVSPMEHAASLLETMVRDRAARRVLEVGCGTAHHLAGLLPEIELCCGLDYSTGMLHLAQKRERALDLVRGRARQIPFPDATFELVYCINAIHHFDDPQGFIGEGRRLLAPEGILVVIGSDPHDQAGRWYVYDYFAGTLETDLGRFPSRGTITNWMVTAGFEEVEWRPAQRILDHRVGREVLDHSFLRKNACSQLALLSEEAYAAGLRRINEALEEAAEAGETLLFPVDIRIGAVVGRVPTDSDGARM